MYRFFHLGTFRETSAISAAKLSYSLDMCNAIHISVGICQPSTLHFDVASQGSFLFRLQRPIIAILVWLLASDMSISQTRRQEHAMQEDSADSGR